MPHVVKGTTISKYYFADCCAAPSARTGRCPTCSISISAVHRSTDASGVKTVHTNNNRPRFFVPRTVCAANKLPVIKLPHGRPKSCKTYRKDILAIAARNGAVNVRVFGSVARCDNNPTAI
jgi:hypothetical protein